MYYLLIGLIAFIGILLSLSILLQSGKGSGLAGIASGGAMNVLGARQAPDFLEKATWILAALFISLCLLTNFAIPRDETTNSNFQDVIRDGSQTEAPITTAPIQDVAPITPAPVTGSTDEN